MGIYNEVGGAAAVAAAVNDFHQRVLADEDLVGYFGGTQLTRLKGHQRAFIAAAIGGSELYAGRNMGEAHARLNVLPEHVDKVVSHLVDALAGLGVPTPTIEAIGAKLAPLKSEIAPGPAARAG